jgi:hypothetical protein
MNGTLGRPIPPPRTTERDTLGCKDITDGRDGKRLS